MSHYITFPLNQNGVIDPAQKSDEIIKESLAKSFGTTEVYIYSHGWWTTADDALKEYNIATTGYRSVVTAVSSPSGPVPRSPLLIGIHWPSAIVDSPSNVNNFFGPLSFYKMEKRADDVGEEGVYGLLRLIFSNSQQPMRISLIGHSFGCKVICAALQKLASDNVKIPAGTSFCAVLLQAAFRTDGLDEHQPYGDVITKFGNDMRMMITHSNADLALKDQFPAARKLDLIDPGVTSALGYTGPTPTVIKRLGSTGNVSVDFGDDLLTRPPFAANAHRLIVADLSPFHNSRKNTYPSNPSTLLSGGHHSDIFTSEIYNLLAWFLQ